MTNGFYEVRTIVNEKNKQTFPSKSKLNSLKLCKMTLKELVLKRCGEFVSEKLH